MVISSQLIKRSLTVFLICLGALAYPHILLLFVVNTVELIGDTYTKKHFFENIRGLLFFIAALVAALVLILLALIIIKKRNIYLPILYGLSGVGYIFIYRTYKMYPHNLDNIVLDILSNIQTFIVFSSVAFCPTIAYWLLVTFVLRLPILSSAVVINKK